jgi:hypothetical protein
MFCSESTGDSVLLQAVCSGLGPLPLTIELQATDVAGERPICAKRKPSEYVRFDPGAVLQRHHGSAH